MTYGYYNDSHGLFCSLTSYNISKSKLPTHVHGRKYEYRQLIILTRVSLSLSLSRKDTHTRHTHTTHTHIHTQQHSICPLFFNPTISFFLFPLNKSYLSLFLSFLCTFSVYLKLENPLFLYFSLSLTLSLFSLFSLLVSLFLSLS